MSRRLALTPLIIVALVAGSPPACSAASEARSNRPTAGESPAAGAATTTASQALSEPTVEVRPQTLAPGMPLRIVVRPPGGHPPRGAFLDHDLTFAPLPDGSGWAAFAGIDLDTQPGRYVLSIEMADAAGTTVAHAEELLVEPKEYPTEELKVESKYVQPPPEVSERIEREAALLQGIWSHAGSEFFFDDRVVRPLAGVDGRNFGRRRVFNGQPRSPHSGTDLSADEGTPVEAAAAGRVALARELYYSGNLVVLDHGAGVYTVYAHLSRLDVKEQQPVGAGDIVGLVGATGRVTGPHLHWGGRIGTARVDPQSLLELLRF